MKRTYISPIAKSIELESEECLLNTSSLDVDMTETDEYGSNRRDDSRSIWGNTEW